MPSCDFDALLTLREREIVQCICEALSNKEIAKRFSISEETVKRHLSNIFDKVGSSSRLELLMMYMHWRLSDPRLSRGYACSVCGRDVLIRSIDMEPRSIAVRVGDQEQVAEMVCPTCAEEINATAAASFSQLRAKGKAAVSPHVRA